MELFPGQTPVVFYDGETRSYRALRGGIALSDYLMGQFTRLLGEDNVIFKYSKKKHVTVVTRFFFVLGSYLSLL